MKPYLLKATLQRKETELHFEACQVDHVLELSGSEFRFFQHNLMEEYDFLREYNKQHASAPARVYETACSFSARIRMMEFSSARRAATTPDTLLSFQTPVRS